MKKSRLKSNPEKNREWHNRSQETQRQKQREPRTQLKRNSHLKPVSAKGRTRREAYRAVRDPFMLLHPICQCCKYRPSTELHHKKGRNRELLVDVQYFAALCHECHYHIHFIAPLWAYENGWLIGKDAQTFETDLEAD